MLPCAASIRAVGAKLLLPAILLALAGCGTLSGTARQPDQRALLLGQLWIADQVAGQPVQTDTRVTLSLYGDGRLVGRTGCNTFTGRFRLDGNALQVSALDVGANSCAPEVAAQEQSYLGTLGAAATYEVQAADQQPGGMLIIAASDGRMLAFHRDATATVQRLDYACEDGTALAVIFDWERGSASVSENGAIAATLARVAVPAGFRFEKAPKSLSGEGAQANWSNAGGTPVACQVAG